VPPGFDGTLNLIPVQQKAEVLFFRHIQHQAHIIPICRHIEPGQSPAALDGVPDFKTPAVRQLLCEVQFLLVPRLSVGPDSHLSPKSSLEAVKYYRAHRLTRLHQDSRDLHF
jgi:hypothetical protein